MPPVCATPSPLLPARPRSRSESFRAVRLGSPYGKPNSRRGHATTRPLTSSCYFLSRLLHALKVPARVLQAPWNVEFANDSACPGRTSSFPRAPAAAGNVGLLAERELDELAHAQRADGSWPGRALLPIRTPTRIFGGESLSTAWGARALMVGSRHSQRPAPARIWPAEVWLDRSAIMKRKPNRRHSRRRSRREWPRHVATQRADHLFRFHCFELNGIRLSWSETNWPICPGRYQLFRRREDVGSPPPDLYHLLLPRCQKTTPYV